MGGGQDKPAWTAFPRGEDNQDGGQDIPGHLAPGGGGELSRGQDKLGHRPICNRLLDILFRRYSSNVLGLNTKIYVFSAINKVRTCVRLTFKC